MRSLLIAATLMVFAAGAAHAKVSITVDKDAQMMTVAVDGVERYHWPVSTGNPSHETPNGSFRTFRMEEDHYSKEFDDAPMPHSIFFTKIGHAIHGTESEGRLGTPVSHGCVRLSRANATTLYALVDRFVHGRAGPQPQGKDRRGTPRSRSGLCSAIWRCCCRRSHLASAAADGTAAVGTTNGATPDFSPDIAAGPRR
jgi:hypothetical protein